MLNSWDSADSDSVNAEPLAQARGWQPRLFGQGTRELHRLHTARRRCSVLVAGSVEEVADLIDCTHSAGQPTFPGWRRRRKAVVDWLVALFALLLLFPLLVMIAVAIKIESPGPVLVRQLRVGQAGQRFFLLKFRSTVAETQRQRADLDAAWLRMTLVGLFLRRYSMDELPQLINVLRGEMSFVGPRPLSPEEAADYASEARQGLLIKPGLTGLWQVSGCSDLSWAETVQVDLRYIEGWSLARDVVIIWMTARAVLGGRGAY
jgi:lipopolysaccharide/colanic/teichoic acid biosynthesis glycosyltransferase